MATTRRKDSPSDHAAAGFESQREFGIETLEHADDRIAETLRRRKEPLRPGEFGVDGAPDDSNGEDSSLSPDTPRHPGAPSLRNHQSDQAAPKVEKSGEAA